MRLYELFMGPLDQVKPWQMSGVEGVSRFLQRAWRLVVDERSGDAVGAPHATRRRRAKPALQRALHVTIKKVLEDTEALRFNTAIAQMMIFVNEATVQRHAAARHRARLPARARALRAAPRRGAVGAARRARSDRARRRGRRTTRRCASTTRSSLPVQVNGKRRDVDHRAARRRCARRSSAWPWPATASCARSTARRRAR